MSVGKAQSEVSVRLCQVGRLCLRFQFGCVSWDGSVWGLSLDVSVGEVLSEVSVRMCQLGRLGLGSQSVVLVGIYQVRCPSFSIRLKCFSLVSIRHFSRKVSGWNLS